MKKYISTIALVLFFYVANGQLKGSGKTVSQEYPISNFDKVFFEDLDGNLEVEIGKSWKISVTIDDNLKDLLEVKLNKEEYALTVGLKGNKNNKMYIEDTNIWVKITMPESSVVSNNGNANLKVSGVLGRYFRLQNNGNGTATVLGNIEMLDLENNGNGNANLQDLLAQEAKLTVKGNGNVILNVQKQVLANVAGNATVINKGTGQYSASSITKGNASIK